MNLATRIANNADRRLVRARVKARARIAVRRYGLAVLVTVCAVIARVGAEARHAEELAAVELRLVRTQAVLAALERLPAPVAIVLAAPDRKTLRDQLANIAGTLDAERVR